MSDSISEADVPFLPKEHEATLRERGEHQVCRSNRSLIVVVALISALISIFGTVIVHSSLSITLMSTSSPREELLPLLDLPPLGSVLRTYMGEPAFYSNDLNATREAWMSLFPRSIGDAGQIPEIFQHISTDGSGRFCVAAFHQLHCLFLIYTDFRRAMDGNFTHADGQTLHDSHSLHCFDYLRESIICSADSALEPFRSPFDGGTQGNGVDGFGSVHQCRDFGKLFKWSEKFRYSNGHDAEKFEG